MLLTVQGLMILHIVQWLLTGTTLTPVEPSETVQTVRDGLINAGFFFFLAALASTVILGRWFCGWGCHVVMLQDFCAWLLKKLGVRPKPFRAKFLLVIPLLLALYMFVWPAAFRFLVWAGLFVDPSQQPWEASMHLTTTDFWRTFPGLAVAIPFLGICGFATVYFLGSKGFCTYGCPYGGFFAPLDRFALGRIRVTEDCEQCGHCTAVCTSNVRVHEEVREFGMVVDPGCMKCLDCVSVCPNHALYFGFAPTVTQHRTAKAGKPKANMDVSPGEDVVLLVVYLAVFVSVLGVYKSVPFLMAAGVAAIVTFLVWKAWRVYRDASVNLHQFRLKYKGHLTQTGLVFLLLAGAIVLLVGHSGAIRILEASARRHVAALGPQAERSLLGGDEQMPADLAHRADRAIRCYQWMSGLTYGGFGLLHDPSIDRGLGPLLCLRGRLDEARLVLQRDIQRNGRNEMVCRTLGLVHQRMNSDAEAKAFYDDLVAGEPTWLALAEDASNWHQRAGRAEDALRLRRMVADQNPQNALAARQYASALVEAGRLEEAIAALEAVVRCDPGDPAAHAELARRLASLGRLTQAQDALSRALLLAPDHAELNRAMGRLLQGMKRPAEAATYFEKARRIESSPLPSTNTR